MAAGGVTQRLTRSVVLMSVLFAVLVLSLYILSNTAENLDQFGQYYFWLLLTDGIVLIFIAVLIASNSLNLFREFRQRVAGARLTVKLIAMSVFLALVPVSLVYTFSVKFLRSNINSLSDVNIEAVMNDALELSRDALASQMRVMRRVTTDIAGQLADVSRQNVRAELDTLGSRIEATELTLLDGENNVIAATGFAEQLSFVPIKPETEIANRAKAGIPYVGVDPIDKGGLLIRVVVPVLTGDAERGNYVLQALYPVGEKSSELAVSVQESYQRYQQMIFLSKPLKLGSILTLSLALLLSVLTALWFAFYAARRMMVPIHDLVEGTRLVADGDYSIRLYKHGDDELRFLVESFNDMTGQLEKSSALAAQSREHLESQRAYLETVLRHISTGVITFDVNGLLRTANDASDRILGEEIVKYIGRDLRDEPDQFSLVAQFYTLNRPYIEKQSDWSCEIEVLHKLGRKLILCRGTQLLDSLGGIAGVVIVFDDITTIMQAQRNAAWSEVARRLAHEIKNPLTPIQLAAERLRRKYLEKMQGKDAELLDRLTYTIVQQVDAMKSMVKAFAEYANTPPVNFVLTDINNLVLEVVDLYQDINDSVDLSLRLGTNLPTISADATRLRQLTHNLIKNALEAQKDSGNPKVLISTQLTQLGENRVFELRVEDSGPGISLQLINKLFEPYVTSKPKGTGLGLAIVKKIVEEHHGLVYAQNREQGGGRIVVQFPVPSSASRVEVTMHE